MVRNPKTGFLTSRLIWVLLLEHLVLLNANNKDINQPFIWTGWFIANLLFRERSSRVLDSRPRGRKFEPHWLHCVVSLSKTH